jgi:signal transduction histidine kinase
VLPPQVEEAAFRIVAESLTNVVRHSAASHCTVQLNQANGDLRLQVFDDGRGLKPSTTPGHGLDSMRKRAADIGGSVCVEIAEPRGTLVTAVLPLEAP